MNIYQIALELMRQQLGRSSSWKTNDDAVNVFIKTVTKLKAGLEPMLAEEKLNAQGFETLTNSTGDKVVVKKPQTSTTSQAGRSAGSQVIQGHDSGFGIGSLLLAGVAGFLLGDNHDTTSVHNSDTDNGSGLSDQSNSDVDNYDSSSSDSSFDNSSDSFDSGSSYDSGGSDFGGGSFD